MPRKGPRILVFPELRNNLLELSNMVGLNKTYRTGQVELLPVMAALMY